MFMGHQHDVAPININAPEPTQPNYPGGIDPYILAAAARNAPHAIDPNLPTRGTFRQFSPRGVAASFSYDAEQIGEGNDRFAFSYFHDSKEYTTVVTVCTKESGKHLTPPLRHSPGHAQEIAVSTPTNPHSSGHCQEIVTSCK